MKSKRRLLPLLLVALLIWGDLNSARASTECSSSESSSFSESVEYVPVVESVESSSPTESAESISSSTESLLNSLLDQNEQQLQDAPTKVMEVREKTLHRDPPGSPVNLFMPDEFQFYTLNNNGQLVRKQMTKQEIQGMIAAGGGGASSSFTVDLGHHQVQQPDSDLKVSDVVQNVQKVLKSELNKPVEIHNTGSSIPGSVNSQWTNMLPYILSGGSLDQQDVGQDTSILLPGLEDDQAYIDTVNLQGEKSPETQYGTETSYVKLKPTTNEQKINLISTKPAVDSSEKPIYLLGNMALDSDILGEQVIYTLPTKGKPLPTTSSIHKVTTMNPSLDFDLKEIVAHLKNSTNTKPTLYIPLSVSPSHLIDSQNQNSYSDTLMKPEYISSLSQSEKDGVKLAISGAGLSTNGANIKKTTTTNQVFSDEPGFTRVPMIQVPVISADKINTTTQGTSHRQTPLFEILPTISPGSITTTVIKEASKPSKINLSQPTKINLGFMGGFKQPETSSKSSVSYHPVYAPVTDSSTTNVKSSAYYPVYEKVNKPTTVKIQLQSYRPVYEPVSKPSVVSVTSSEKEPITFKPISENSGLKVTQTTRKASSPALEFVTKPTTLSEEYKVTKYPSNLLYKYTTLKNSSPTVEVVTEPSSEEESINVSKFPVRTQESTIENGDNSDVIYTDQQSPIYEKQPSISSSSQNVEYKVPKYPSNTQYKYTTIKQSSSEVTTQPTEEKLIELSKYPVNTQYKYTTIKTSSPTTEIVTEPTTEADLIKLSKYPGNTQYKYTTVKDSSSTIKTITKPSTEQTLVELSKYPGSTQHKYTIIKNSSPTVEYTTEPSTLEELVKESKYPSVTQYTTVKKSSPAIEVVSKPSTQQQVIVSESADSSAEVPVKNEVTKYPSNTQYKYSTIITSSPTWEIVTEPNLQEKIINELKPSVSSEEPFENVDTGKESSPTIEVVSEPNSQQEIIVSHPAASSEVPVENVEIVKESSPIIEEVSEPSTQKKVIVSQSAVSSQEVPVEKEEVVKESSPIIEEVSKLSTQNEVQVSQPVISSEEIPVEKVNIINKSSPVIEVASEPSSQKEIIVSQSATSSEVPVENMNIVKESTPTIEVINEPNAQKEVIISQPSVSLEEVPIENVNTVKESSPIIEVVNEPNTQKEVSIFQSAVSSEEIPVENVNIAKESSPTTEVVSEPNAQKDVIAPQSAVSSEEIPVKNKNTDSHLVYTDQQIPTYERPSVSSSSQNVEYKITKYPSDTQYKYNIIKSQSPTTEVVTEPSTQKEIIVSKPPVSTEEVEKEHKDSYLVYASEQSPELKKQVVIPSESLIVQNSDEEKPKETTEQGSIIETDSYPHGTYTVPEKDTDSGDWKKYSYLTGINTDRNYYTTVPKETVLDNEENTESGELRVTKYPIKTQYTTIKTSSPTTEVTSEPGTQKEVIVSKSPINSEKVPVANKNKDSYLVNITQQESTNKQHPSTSSTVQKVKYKITEYPSKTQYKYTTIKQSSPTIEVVSEPNTQKEVIVSQPVISSEEIPVENVDTVKKSSPTVEVVNVPSTQKEVIVSKSPEGLKESPVEHVDKETYTVNAAQQEPVYEQVTTYPSNTQYTYTTTTDSSPIVKVESEPSTQDELRSPVSLEKVPVANDEADSHVVDTTQHDITYEKYPTVQSAVIKNKTPSTIYAYVTKSSQSHVVETVTPGQQQTEKTEEYTVHEDSIPHTIVTELSLESITDKTETDKSPVQIVETVSPVVPNQPDITKEDTQYIQVVQKNTEESPIVHIEKSPTAYQQTDEIHTVHVDEPEPTIDSTENKLITQTDPVGEESTEYLVIPNSNETKEISKEHIDNEQETITAPTKDSSTITETKYADSTTGDSSPVQIVVVQAEKDNSTEAILTKEPTIETTDNAVLETENIDTKQSNDENVEVIKEKDTNDETVLPQIYESKPVNENKITTVYSNGDSSNTDSHVVTYETEPTAKITHTITKDEQPIEILITKTEEKPSQENKNIEIVKEISEIPDTEKTSSEINKNSPEEADVTPIYQKTETITENSPSTQDEIRHVPTIQVTEEKEQNKPSILVTETNTDGNKKDEPLLEDELSTVKVIPVYDDDTSIYNLPNDVPTEKISQSSTAVTSNFGTNPSKIIQSPSSLSSNKITHIVKPSTTSYTDLPGLHETYNNYVKEHYNTKLPIYEQQDDTSYLTTFPTVTRTQSSNDENKVSTLKSTTINLLRPGEQKYEIHQYKPQINKYLTSSTSKVYSYTPTPALENTDTSEPLIPLRVQEPNSGTLTPIDNSNLTTIDKSTIFSEPLIPLRVEEPSSETLTAIDNSDSTTIDTSTISSESISEPLIPLRVQEPSSETLTPIDNSDSTTIDTSTISSESISEPLIPLRVQEPSSETLTPIDNSDLTTIDTSTISSESISEPLIPLRVQEPSSETLTPIDNSDLTTIDKSTISSESISEPLIPSSETLTPIDNSDLTTIDKSTISSETISEPLIQLPVKETNSETLTPIDNSDLTTIDKSYISSESISEPLIPLQIQETSSETLTPIDNLDLTTIDKLTVPSESSSETVIPVRIPETSSEDKQTIITKHPVVINSNKDETPITYLNLMTPNTDKKNVPHQSNADDTGSSSVTRITINNPVSDVDKIISESQPQEYTPSIEYYTLPSDISAPNKIASDLIARYPTYNQGTINTKSIPSTTTQKIISETSTPSVITESVQLEPHEIISTVKQTDENVSYFEKPTTTTILSVPESSEGNTSSETIYHVQSGETSTSDYESSEIPSSEIYTQIPFESLPIANESEADNSSFNPPLEKISDLINQLQNLPSEHNPIGFDYSNGIATTIVPLDKFETIMTESNPTTTDEHLEEILSYLDKTSTELQNSTYVVLQTLPSTNTTTVTTSTPSQSSTKYTTYHTTTKGPSLSRTTVLSIVKQPVTGKPYVTSTYKTTKGTFEKIQSTIDKSAGRINLEEEKNKIQLLKPTEPTKFTMKNKNHYTTIRRPTTGVHQSYITRKTTTIPSNKATAVTTFTNHSTSKPITDTKEVNADKWTLIPQKSNVDHVVEVKKTAMIAKEGAQPPHPQIVTLDHTSGAIGLDQSNKGLDADVAEFLNMCNELSFKFWTLVTADLTPSRSVTVSPFGMISTLAMIFLGARGLTSNQMNDILKLDDVVTFNPHLVFQNITDTVTLARGQGIENAAFVRALFADRLKVRKIMPFYKEQAQQFYEGAVVDINFSTAGDILRRRTNLLIRKQTGGRIKDFVKLHTLPLRSPLTALSANVFQTSCDSPDASSEGRDGEMYFAVSQTVKQRKLVPIPAVVWKSGVSAGYEPSLDATAVALGDPKKPVSLIMIMPGQQGVTAPGDNLERLEQRLFGNPSDNALEKLLKVIVPRRVEVQVPKFSHRSILNVTSALKQMGFDQLFTKNADLKGINGAGHDLYLADMIQMNLFQTCGDENKLGGRHLSETYPGSSSRTMRKWRTISNVNDGVQILEDDVSSDYLSDELSADYSSSETYERVVDLDDLISLTSAEDLSPEEIQAYRIKKHVFHPSQLNLDTYVHPVKTLIPNLRLEVSKPTLGLLRRNRRQVELEKPRMKMDKPFLYLIRHNLTGLILHIGRFNPKNQS